MSHVADVQFKARDLDALKAAVALIDGAHFMEGQRTHKWFGKFLNDWSNPRAAVNRVDPKTFGKCEHAIKLDGVDYEIGVVKAADGDGYDLIYDSWGGQLEARLGVGLPMLKQVYTTELTRRELARQGKRVTTEKQADGSIRLRATGGR